MKVFFLPASCKIPALLAASAFYILMGSIDKIYCHKNINFKLQKEEVQRKTDHPLTLLLQSSFGCPPVILRKKYLFSEAGPKVIRRRPEEQVENTGQNRS